MDTIYRIVEHKTQNNDWKFGIRIVLMWKSLAGNAFLKIVADYALHMSPLNNCSTVW